MIANFDFCRLNLQVFVTKWHGGVSILLIGDGGHVSNNSRIFIKVVDRDMLNERRRLGYREVTAYRSIGSCCYSWIKK